jgi:hypothetical protein
MAKIFGIVAGGIGIVSFVVRTGDSLVKLKDFARSTKNAPEELTSLIQGIENLNRNLKVIGTRAKQFSISDGDDVIDKPLHSCHRAAQDFYQVARSLEQEIIVGSQKARFKFAHKKQFLKDLRTRLEETKQDVLIAHAASTMLVG